ncbi:MAG: putative lipid II flippase FtsW [Candidatus Gottesmanbacteria bacterium]
MRLLSKSSTRIRQSSLILHRQNKGMDILLLIATVLICLIGLLFIFEASGVSAARTFNDKYYFLKEQSMWFGLGLITMIVISLFDYHHYYKLALPIIIGVIFLLIAVFIPGLGVKALGARRWINLGFSTIQPSEVAKLALVIYLAAWFSYKEKSRLIAFMILMGIIVGLIVIQPDLGTAIIVCLIALCIYFISGVPFWHFLLLVPLTGGAVFFLSIISPYRFKRLITFLNPSVDPLGMSYHIRQVLLALGSGGLWGLGLGKSRQKFEYLPEAMTDSIFAIFAEELGFIGCLVLIMIFLFILWRAVKIAIKAPDRLGHLLAFGITSWIGIQTIINLGAMVALVPLTGVPLPFISYGGSNLVMTLIGIGILLNISRQGVVRTR